MRTQLNNGREYELEEQYGLPEKLPLGEQVLWQGSPHVWRTAKDIFYIRPIMVYFSFLVFYRLYDGIVLEHTFKVILISITWMFVLSIVSTGLIASLAYFTARSTAYTITNRRVIMRIGIALTMSFNLPFKEIVSADFKAQKDGYGNIPLKIASHTKIAYFHLWPHVRPMRFVHPEPMLRNIPNVEQVSAILAQAWAIENDIALQTKKSPMAQHDRRRPTIAVGLTKDLGLT